MSSVSKLKKSTQDSKPSNEDRGFWGKVDKLDTFATWAMLNMGPGPNFIKFNENINLNKGSLPVIIMALMIYYQNFSIGMWMYFVMHSTYGILWFSKDMIFPDKCH